MIKKFSQKMKGIALLATIVMSAVTTVQAQTVNLNNKIVLTVLSGEQIEFKFRAVADATPVRIVSGSNTQDISVGTTPTDFQKFTSDGTTMTIYGDLDAFNCRGNKSKITAIDASGHTTLFELRCYGNALTSLNVNGAGNINWIYCDDNQLDACALDALFLSLPQQQTSVDARVYIKDGATTNPGTDGCRTPIATAKNWSVMDYDGFKVINNTNFTCPETSLNNVSVATLTLCPNPVADVLHIEVESEVRTIKVYNMSGMEVASATRTTQISLAHLPEGVYTVAVDTAKGIARDKIVKK